MPCPPSFQSPPACGLVRQLSECHRQDVCLASPYRIMLQISQAGPRRTVRKIYPIFTYIIPFSRPSIQSMLRTVIILEQNKKPLGTNAFCISIYDLCEPHTTRSVRRHGMRSLKSADCPLEGRRDSSWLNIARDCHSTGDITSLRRLSDGEGCRL